MWERGWGGLFVEENSLLLLNNDMVWRHTVLCKITTTLIFMNLSEMETYVCHTDWQLKCMNMEDNSNVAGHIFWGQLQMPTQETNASWPEMGHVFPALNIHCDEIQVSLYQLNKSGTKVKCQVWDTPNLVMYHAQFTSLLSALIRVSA